MNSLNERKQLSLYDKLQTLPEVFEQLSGHSYIQLLDHNELSVEGCAGILEYEENIISMRLRKINCTITGLSLSIENFSNGNIVITGRFHSISFEERGNEHGQ